MAARSSNPVPFDPPTPSSRSKPPPGRGRIRTALAFCLERRNLSRTIRIAAMVGILLTLINQGWVIADGHANVATWVRCALNFIVPFLVSNAGLLSAR